MDKPVFIRCEVCDKVYKEHYVLKRKQMHITKGKCDFCIFDEYKSGKLSYEEAAERINK